MKFAEMLIKVTPCRPCTVNNLRLILVIWTMTYTTTCSFINHVCCFIYGKTLLIILTHFTFYSPFSRNHWLERCWWKFLIFANHSIMPRYQPCENESNHFCQHYNSCISNDFWANPLSIITNLSLNIHVYLKKI